MATIYLLERIKTLRASQGAKHPALECPICDTLCQAALVDISETVTYICHGNGHKKLVWRINANGDMLRGATGNKFY